MLREADIPVAVEAGAVKEWSPDARAAFNLLRDVVLRRLRPQVRLVSVMLDEPGCHGFGTRQQILAEPHQARVAAATAWFIQQVRALKMHLEVGLIMPYPLLPMSVLLRFVERIQAAGGGPASLALDVDRFGLHDLGIPDDASARDLREAARRCRDWAIPFRVIMFGQRAANVREYAERVATVRQQWWRFQRPKRIAAGVLPWAARVREIFGQDMPEQVVQSWEAGPDGVKDMPHNLPEWDPYAHAAHVVALSGGR
jgi:hypothetical protein